MRRLLPHAPWLAGPVPEAARSLKLFKADPGDRLAAVRAFDIAVGCAGSEARALGHEVLGARVGASWLCAVPGVAGPMPGHRWLAPDRRPVGGGVRVAREIRAHVARIRGEIRQLLVDAETVVPVFGDRRLGAWRAQHVVDAGSALAIHFRSCFRRAVRAIQIGPADVTPRDRALRCQHGDPLAGRRSRNSVRRQVPPASRRPWA